MSFLDCAQLIQFADMHTWPLLDLP